jgi:probable HAF family extracellular repeat protein/parallel beta-helix repeat protein
MAPLFLRNWLNRTSQAARTGSRRAGLPTRWRSRLWLQVLEGRTLPSAVTNLADAGAGSLRQAILDTPPGGTVDFQPGLSGTITLTTGELAINQDLTIAGPGANVITVSGNHASRVFDITGTVVVTISGLTIANGQSSGGGAIVNYTGTLTLTDSAISGNVASGSTGGPGGGILNYGTLTIIACTVSGNSAHATGHFGYGGGIASWDGGMLTVIDSTISGNTAAGSELGYGGGISNSGGTLTVIGDTISGNFPGDIRSIGNPVMARNSIISAADGTFDSQGHNLIGNVTSGSGYAPTDLVGSSGNRLDPKLGPLQDNGGPTQTMALLPGSPAIAAGDATGARAWDQRGPGYARTVSGTIDIGAYEVQTTQVFPVTSTADAGAGTLRQAILDANAHPGYDVVTFNVPGTTVQTIAPITPLPAVAVPVYVNGTSQPGFAGTPIIRLNGAAAGAGADGLTLAGGTSVVRGLAVGGFGGAGVHLEGAGGNLVIGNYLGTDPSGNQADANGTGLLVDATANNTVTGNLISGNTGAGLSLAGNSNQVRNNIIGTNAAYTARLDNGTGIVISGSNNTVGARYDGGLNLIAANLGDGLLLSAGATGNVVQYNVIGRNRGNGVEVAAGASGTALLGNAIGTTTAGTRNLPNGLNGVLVAGSDNTVGGTAEFSGNVIGLNALDGVRITGSAASGNRVQNNAIGTNYYHTLALGNLGNGVGLVDASGNTVGGTVTGAANTIAYNGEDGVLVDTGTADAVRQNAIFANGGLGIELRNNGNLNQAAPALSLAYSGLGTTVVRGTLTATPDTTFVVEWFADSDRGGGQGERLLGSLSLTTDASGQAPFREILSGINLTAGQFVTATATDPAGNTSEFSSLAVTPTPLMTIVLTGARDTYAQGINNAGQIVGAYLDQDGSRGFLLSGGTYTTLDAPFATGINDAGQIVGWDADQHGFLLSGGTYTTLDVPGAASTFPQGINDAGQVVGLYYDAGSGEHGFLLSGGTYTTLDAPGAIVTQADGINDAGQVVGWYSDAAGEHGFLLSGGTYTMLDVPGAAYTYAAGINDTGQVVGWYSDAAGDDHGFLLTGGTYTTLDAPGAAATHAQGINDAGQIVGWYTDVRDHSNGFLLSGDTYATLDAPGPADTTSAAGINNAGQVVGWYTDALGTHGFALSGGTYTTLDAPGAPNTTFAAGINNAGQVVGWYTDALGTHGFLLNGDTYTTLDVPGAASTYAEGINDAGQVVGWYTDALGTHGFALSGGTYTTLDAPGTPNTTYAAGINDAGQIVGWYRDTQGRTHGFLLAGGTYTTLDVPGAGSTQAYGINDAGLIVGNTDSGGFLLVGGTYALINIPNVYSTSVYGINDVGQIVGAYSGSFGSPGFVATRPSAPGSSAEPALSALTPALAAVPLGPSVPPADGSRQGPVVGAEPAAPLAYPGSDPLNLYSAGLARDEAAATLPSLATLHHARDAVFAGLGDPVADGLAGSLLSAGW